MPHLFTTTLQSQPGSKRHSALSNRTDQSRVTQRLHIASLLLITIFCGLTLSGCDDAGDTLWDLFSSNGGAEAQIVAEQRVQTYIIVTDSFRIEIDDGDPNPTTSTQDGATQYTMASDGTVRFDISNDDTDVRSFDVEAGDIVIERPGTNGNAGTVTLIRASL
jgi:hypothetical protein